MKRLYLAAASVLVLSLWLSACAPDGGFMPSSPNAARQHPDRGPYVSGGGGMGY